MKSFPIKCALALLAVMAGLAIGELVQSASAHAGAPDDERGAVPEGKRQSPVLRSHAAAFLQKETASLWGANDFVGETERLYREAKSPLRTRFTLSYHVQEKSFDEWAMMMENKQVLREDLLRDVGSRLAETDPVRALDMLLLDRTYRLETMDQYYAFREGIFRTVVRQNPGLGLAALKKLERGGVQMDNSLFFSAEWARYDPKGAAGNFEDLVELRNMEMGGSIELPGARYAKEVMNSWVSKDRDAAIAYTKGLSDGPTKETFKGALEGLLEQGE
jgi:hypothetical protein